MEILIVVLVIGALGLAFQLDAYRTKWLEERRAHSDTKNEMTALMLTIGSRYNITVVKEPERVVEARTVVKRLKKETKE